ncbi:MAG TPA: NHL repeat-containing protein [Ktedonobacterales bacterium]|nr:NHL repeat-containing protein [Ktedonobacterales bacterium]
MPRSQLSHQWKLQPPALALVVGALLCCLVLPPIVAFEPARLPAFALLGIGATLLMLSVLVDVHRWLQFALYIAGGALLWLLVCWCVFSQVSPLTETRNTTWGLRGLPVALLLGVWLWLLLPLAWQRRALLAAVVPSLLALAFIAWTSPPHPLDFQPYYVAVDSGGVMYVTDAYAPVIRVFAPDGTLRVKLRPGVASVQGPPGPGFTPPGPYNDPDGLGVPRGTPGARTISGALNPVPYGRDDFWFCGLAVDAARDLYVPDWMRGRMLRFSADGRLLARWSLPHGYEPSLNCVAVLGNDLLLSDTHGAVLRLDASGHVLARWKIPERLFGGLTVAPDGNTVYALATTRVYRISPVTGAISSWALPAPTTTLGTPYQAILALDAHRIVVTDLGWHRLDLFTPDGHPLGFWGQHGIWPGSFQQVGGIARDREGHVYICDFDGRVIQRFSPAGKINALYWSPDDDEID